MKSFKVATFYHPELRTKVSAYTRIYNTQWEGCRIYDVEAESGKEAKKIATKMRLDDEKKPIDFLDDPNEIPQEIGFDDEPLHGLH